MKKRYLLLLFTCLGLASAESKKPNIIFLLADDQSSYSVGIYGNKDVKTPEMDKIGNQGLIFDRHYDTTAICMASRANIMTGMFEYKTGCNFDHGGLTEDKFAQSYPVLLRQAGYYTGFAGKFGIDGIENPQEHFDVWGGSPGQSSYNTAKNKSMAKYAEKYPHSTLSYGAFGQDFIKEAVSKKKSFCLSISFKAPHKPAEPDPKFDHIYDGVTFKKPANYGREHGAHLSEQSRKGRQYERFEDWNYSDKYQETMSIYHQQIYGVDVAIGMIREELEKQGIADNTVIIYTSDNGFICGSHGYGSKVLPYEESMRVPLMIFDPRHKVSGKGLRTASLTGNVDFAPTILELAGLPVPENMDGESLLPILNDTKADIHESLPLINVWGPAPTHFLGVITKDWKYTYWSYAGEGMKETEELFNVSKDGLELKNEALNPEHGPMLETMRANYDKHLKTWSDNAVEGNDYKRFAKLFDRNLSWSEKADSLVNKDKPEKVVSQLFCKFAKLFSVISITC